MSDDLIERQAAIDALHMHLMYRMGTDSNKKRLDEWINNLPSAQPEIIRCKECKFWGARELCQIWDEYISNESFYCGCAERRTDE